MEVGYHQAWNASIIEVSRVHAHPGACFAVFAERDTRPHADLLELSVAKISIQLVGLRVIGNKQVRPAVVVVIKCGHPKGLRACVEYSRFRCHIFETPVPEISEKPAGD